jgi:hypothetical protein
VATGEQPLDLGLVRRGPAGGGVDIEAYAVQPERAVADLRRSYQIVLLAMAMSGCVIVPVIGRLRRLGPGRGGVVVLVLLHLARRRRQPPPAQPRHLGFQLAHTFLALFVALQQILNCALHQQQAFALGLRERSLRRAGKQERG